MAAQQENIMRFMNAKEKARKLIQMDALGEIDKVRNKAVSEGKLSYSETDDSQLLESAPQQQIPQNTQPMQQTIVRNNNLPPEILESMMSNKIDTSSLGNGISSTGSILDQLNGITKGKLLENAKQKNEKPKQIVNEEKLPSTIDYSVIKSIVEDCMRKYSSSIKKSIINENKKINEDNSLQAMKIGNKFSFITKNGDLYEANLKFIKNVNKQ